MGKAMRNGYRTLKGSEHLGNRSRFEDDTKVK
jgi:hypothetical protein